MGSSGFDVIFVETVGVRAVGNRGRRYDRSVSVAVAARGGDDLQGIKRGIMELADMVLVNKADGELAAAARHSAADYRSALTLIHPRTSGWKVPVKTCSAAEGKRPQKPGIRSRISCPHRQNGQLAHRAQLQAKSWMWSEISEGC